MAEIKDFKDVFKSMNESILVQTNIFDQMVLSNENMISIKETIEAQTEVLRESIKIEKESLERQKRAQELARVSGNNTSPTPSGTPPIDNREDELPTQSDYNATFFAMFGPKGAIFAGITALGLAAAGLRGWEKDAISRLTRSISSLTQRVTDGARNLRNTILVRYFGFSAENTPGRDPTTGRFTSGRTVSQQIADRIDKLRTRALGIFGLGPDGTARRIDLPDGSQRTSFIGRVTSGINRLLSPLRTVANGVTSFITGAGRKLFSFIEPLMSAGGGFVKLVGRILKPIGVIFSAWEGITAYMNSEGSVFERFGAGIGAALGDFVGAPFDLLKNAMAWIVGKLFGIESEDGSYDESNVMGRILNKVKEFSFENLISNLVEAPFKFISATWDWIKTLFTDPVAALNELWTGLVGEGGVLDIVWMPLNYAIDWITKKFGWREKDAPQFNMLEFIKDSWNNVRETVIEKFNSFTDYISTIPERMKLFAEGMFIDVSEKVRIGFAKFGNWIASIPARIKLMALNAIRSATSGLPEWAQIVSQEDIDEAQQAVDNRNAQLEDTISEIRSSAQESREDLQERMRQLNAVEENAVAGGTQPVVVQYAPNIAPSIQQSVQGGTVSTQNSLFGGGSGSLNFGLPGAAQ